MFVFNKESDETEEDNQIFAKHLAHGIKVLLYYDGENKFTFPPEVGSDWTAIDDGDVIGKTLNVGAYYEARWYFRNQGERRRFVFLKNRVKTLAMKFSPQGSKSGNG